MNMVIPIDNKIAALIPRLASDKDGEIVATARAIGRQLKKTGSDWHDLAARLTTPEVMYPPAGNPGCVTNYREALDWIAANDGGLLSAKEARFVSDMRRNLSRWGNPTPKQAGWIDSLLEKTRGYWV